MAMSSPDPNWGFKPDSSILDEFEHMNSLEDNSSCLWSLNVKDIDDIDDLCGPNNSIFETVEDDIWLNQISTRASDFSASDLPGWNNIYENNETAPSPEGFCPLQLENIEGMDFQFTPSNDFAFDENYHPILSLDQILPKENSESELKKYLLSPKKPVQKDLKSSKQKKRKQSVKKNSTITKLKNASQKFVKKVEAETYTDKSPCNELLKQLATKPTVCVNDKVIKNERNVLSTSKSPQPVKRKSVISEATRDAKLAEFAKKKQPIRRAAKLIDPLPNKPVVKQKILKPNPEASTTKTTLPVVVGPNKLEDHDYCVVFQPNDESASSMSDDKDLPAGLIRVKRLPNIKSAPTTPSNSPKAQRGSKRVTNYMITKDGKIGLKSPLVGEILEKPKIYESPIEAAKNKRKTKMDVNLKSFENYLKNINTGVSRDVEGNIRTPQNGFCQLNVGGMLHTVAVNSETPRNFSSQSLPSSPMLKETFEDLESSSDHLRDPRVPKSTKAVDLARVNYEAKKPRARGRSSCKNSFPLVKVIPSSNGIPDQSRSLTVAMRGAEDDQKRIFSLQKNVKDEEVRKKLIDNVCDTVTVIKSDCGSFKTLPTKVFPISKSKNKIAPQLTLLHEINRDLEKESSVKVVPRSILNNKNVKIHKIQGVHRLSTTKLNSSFSIVNTTSLGKKISKVIPVLPMKEVQDKTKYKPINPILNSTIPKMATVRIVSKDSKNFISRLPYQYANQRKVRIIDGSNITDKIRPNMVVIPKSGFKSEKSPDSAVGTDHSDASSSPASIPDELIKEWNPNQLIHKNKLLSKQLNSPPLDDRLEHFGNNGDKEELDFEPDDYFTVSQLLSNTLQDVESKTTNSSVSSQENKDDCETSAAVASIQGDVLPVETSEDCDRVVHSNLPNFPVFFGPQEVEEIQKSIHQQYESKIEETILRLKKTEQSKHHLENKVAELTKELAERKRMEARRSSQTRDSRHKSSYSRVTDGYSSDESRFANSPPRPRRPSPSYHPYNPESTQSRTKKYDNSSSFRASSPQRRSLSSERSFNRNRNKRYLEDNDQLYQSKRRKESLEKKKEMEAVDERRVVFVGGFDDSMSECYLMKRFTKFGAIENLKVFRRAKDDGRESYAFIYFIRKADANKAIEEGNIGESHQLQLSFGGRRKFCKQRYRDLDDCVDVDSDKSEEDDLATLLSRHRELQENCES